MDVCEHAIEELLNVNITKDEILFYEIYLAQNEACKSCDTYLR
jgi:hypothetical protein